MVAGLHNGGALELFRPDLSLPVTNGKEVLIVAGVSLDGVDGAVMLALLHTELQVDFDLLSLVSLQDVALLGTDQILKRGSLSVVLETSTSKDLRDGLSVDCEVLDELELLSRAGFEVSLIPPEKTTIGGSGYTLSTRLSSNPGDVIHRVVM